MTDPVWPTHRPSRMSSRNGFGLELKGFTRPDAAGRCFATCWIVVFGLPVVPLSRLYLKERSYTVRTKGILFSATARYEVDGESRLRRAELARTYAFCWLIGPAAVIVPILLLLANAERMVGEDGSTVSTLLLVGTFLFLLIASVTALSVILTHYRARWAPLRTAVWTDPPS